MSNAHDVFITLFDSNGHAHSFWCEYYTGTNAADDPSEVTPSVDADEYAVLCDAFGGESELLCRAHQAAAEQYFDSTSGVDVEVLPAQNDSLGVAS